MTPPRASEAAGIAERAAQTVSLLARDPRPAGGPAEGAARTACASRLRDAGFDVREEPFEYSGFVGRWGTPVGGLAGATILLIAGRAGRNGEAGAALIVLTLGAAVLGLVARWLARDGVLSFPLDRRRGVNLVATRGSGSPATWLMAHVDSKSQPVPILVRAAGVTLVVLAWMAAVALASSQALAGPGTTTSALWVAVGVATVLGAIPIVATTVGSRSPGALDNASGVAAVLLAAELSAPTPLGVCLTSAEELGMAGARAWVRARERPATGIVAINCDGIDDRGATTSMHSGRRPDALVDAVVAAGARVGSAVRAHRLLPGVLTDGVALADAGWPVVTLSKGGLRTLARVHTPHDRADRLTGAGIAEVASVIVGLIESRRSNGGR